MSYILDALRRADAERERGAVPNLHAQHIASLPDDDEPAARPKALLWVVAGLALALLAALAWNFYGREAPRLVAAPSAPASAVLPIAALPASAAATLPASAAAMAATPAAVATAAASAPPPAHARASRDARTSTHTATSPARSARTRDERDANRNAASRRDTQRDAAPERNPDRNAAPKREADRDAPPKREANRDAAPTRTDRDADAATRIYAQRDLPDAVRRELPGVKVSGSTYSSNSASRMLMINGLIFHEGDSVANGLVLQQIKPHGAVFAFKGYRYQIEF